MPSSSGAEGTLASPAEQQANAPVETTMDAKLMVATDSGDVQQLKDLVKKQEDSKTTMMVVVMAKEQQAPAGKPQQGNMDPHLLALASSGSHEELLKYLLPTTTTTSSSSREDGLDASGNDGSLPATPTRRRASSSNGNHDIEAAANESSTSILLAGVTAEGDTALHVVAACGYGDGDNFLTCARIIYEKARHLLFSQNKNGDTPLHCAARAGKSNMVECLIGLAFSEGDEGRMNELLRKENKHKETALHEAVRIGNNDVVDLLMNKDPELASFPEEEEDGGIGIDNGTGGGASPLYLAIVLKRDQIVKTLYEKTSSRHGKLSFSGPNGQNALHAAVLRCRDQAGLTKLLEWNKTHLFPQSKDLTKQRDANGSTPLHFAAAIMFMTRFRGASSSICRQVLEANTDALYLPDHAGFFPIHVAASVGAFKNVEMFVDKCPGSAGLRDAKGRTFLHVAVEKKHVKVVRSACRNRSLSWIMNMVDNDGNTALHLAVQDGSLYKFGSLMANPQVNLNLPNRKGETPLDIAEYKIPGEGLFNNQNCEAQIYGTLRTAGAVKGVRRQDHLGDDKTARVKHDESKEMEVLKDSTQTLSIGSVLIATVTFGATFAVPGGYIADDHNNGGSPILAPRYAFDAFIASNTLAFVFSMVATIALMQSGSPLLSPRRRRAHFLAASYLVSISIQSLAAAFALGAYVMLAPVAHKTAVATCVLTSLVLLYKNQEFIYRRILLLQPLCTRKGFIWALVYSAMVIVGNILVENWPLIFIFGWAAHASPAPRTGEPAAQAPAPLLA